MGILADMDLLGPRSPIPEEAVGHCFRELA